MSVAACFLFQGAAAAVATADTPAPRLELREVADQELAQALELGYNLPALGGAVTAEQRSATLKAECLRLVEMMRSLGYLDASVKYIDDVELNGPPAMCPSAVTEGRHDWDKVVLIPVPGNLYRIGIVELDGIGDAGLQQATVADLANLLSRFTGSVARADTLSRLENEILFRIHVASRPAARVAQRSVSTDVEANLAKVHLSIEVGMPLRFGAVTFRHLRRLAPQTLLQHVPFLPGDAYDADQLSEYKQKLEALGLSSSVRIDNGEVSKDTGLVPIVVTFNEKAPSVEELWDTGFDGLMVSAIALVLLGTRQLISEAGVSRRYRIGVGALAGIFVFAAAAFATLRIIGFLGPG